MTSDGWVRVGLDANGEVHVTADVDADGMRTVRFGNGRELRFNPDVVHVDWPDSLTHWDLALYPVVFHRHCRGHRRDDLSPAASEHFAHD